MLEQLTVSKPLLLPLLFWHAWLAANLSTIFTIADKSFPAISNHQFSYLNSFHLLYSPPGLVIPTMLMVTELFFCVY
jgi:hypothetical protein